MSLVIVFPSHQTSLVERNRRILARSVRPASAAVAKARFRGVPAARLHYRSKEKLLSGLCHDRMSLAIMRLDDASVCAKHRARHPRFVERLLREVTRFVARPAPVNLERSAKNQNDENECSTQGNDLALGASASRTDTRGHPNTGRCRQTMYVTTFVISHNNACPQETDPGHDAVGLSSSDLGPSSSVLELKPNKSESLSVGARHRLHPLPSGAPNS
jgi:hypothetical protein